MWCDGYSGTKQTEMKDLFKTIIHPNTNTNWLLYEKEPKERGEKKKKRGKKKKEEEKNKKKEKISVTSVAILASAT